MRHSVIRMSRPLLIVHDLQSSVGETEEATILAIFHGKLAERLASKLCQLFRDFVPDEEVTKDYLYINVPPGHLLRPGKHVSETIQCAQRQGDGVLIVQLLRKMIMSPFRVHEFQ